MVSAWCHHVSQSASASNLLVKSVESTYLECQPRLWCLASLRHSVCDDHHWVWKEGLTSLGLETGIDAGAVLDWGLAAQVWQVRRPLLRIVQQPACMLSVIFMNLACDIMLIMDIKLPLLPVTNEQLIATVKPEFDNHRILAQ